MSLLVLTIASTVNVFIALGVILRNHRSFTNILFFLLIIDVVIWSFFNHIAVLQTDQDGALQWIRLVMSLAVLQAMLFFLLMHTFPSKSLNFSRNKLIVYLILGGFITYLTLTDAVFHSVTYYDQSFNPTPNPGILFFLIYAIGSILGGDSRFYQKILERKKPTKRTDEMDRTRAFYNVCANSDF